MDAMRQKHPAEPACVEKPQGEAREIVDVGTEAFVAKHRIEGSAFSEKLMEEVCTPANLNVAFKRVRSNRGAPGVDGMTVDDLKGHLREQWPAIREQLMQGTYRPQPARRVEIPKRGKDGSRKLGIPTVLDRFVQQAVMQVLQRRFDPTFSEHSFGFRPSRSAHQAVEQAQQYVQEGYTVVVDIDLENFFDQINHDRLLSTVAKTVKDKRVLKLIRSFLTAGVLENGLVGPTDEGAPQGGPLSPLLSNIVLDELDKELERRRHKFVRYADDCNIYVRTERAGKRVMDSIERFINRKLKLRVNQHKSAVASVGKRKFLGFCILSEKQHKRCIAVEAQKRFKDRIREITRRSRGISLKWMVEELNTYMRGWLAYFGFCETPSILRNLDSWIRRRLRSVIWKQWKTFRKRRASLMAKGVNERDASRTAFSPCGPWRMSHVPSTRMALRNAYFDKLGLLRLSQGNA